MNPFQQRSRFVSGNQALKPTLNPLTGEAVLSISAAP